jgi:isopentenyl phosphate kinase
MTGIQKIPDTMTKINPRVMEKLITTTINPIILKPKTNGIPG